MRTEEEQRRYLQRRWEGLKKMAKSDRPNVSMEAALEGLGMFEEKGDTRLHLQLAFKFLSWFIPALCRFYDWSEDDISQSRQTGRDLAKLFAQAGGTESFK